MNRRDLTFRVFVSSTFSDMKAERDALQETTFQQLREYCARRGARFQAIDLRWGVSEEAALDQQTMRICLEELHRSREVSPRPNFIVLLGERYGWRPLPAAIPADEFEQLLPLMDEEARRLAAGEKGDGAWYRRDDNAVPPEYVLGARRVPVAAGSTEEQRRAALAGEAAEWHGRIEPALHAGLRAAAQACWPNTAEPCRQKYEDSATHQEVRRGAFSAEAPGGHVFAYFRTIDGLPPDDRATGYRDLAEGKVDEGVRTRLDVLKEDLRSRLRDNVRDYQAQWIEACGSNGTGSVSGDHLPDLCRQVFDDLRRVIDEELAAFEGRAVFEREDEAHREFGRSRTVNFVGRATELSRIREYADDPSTSPFVVHGAAGSGKTALLARAAEQLAAQPGRVFPRYIGATPGSSDLRSLLDGLCRQIEPDRPVPTDLNDLIREFTVRLERAAASRPLVVLLDGLDQLAPSDGAHQLRWLPWELPRGVKLVVSVLDSDGIDGDCGRAARGLGRPADRLRMGVLDSGDADRLLTSWLLQTGRTLQPEQRSAVLGDGSGDILLPLRLKLAFEEARGWRSFDSSEILSPDTQGVIADLLARLEEEQYHGPVMTGRALGYLAAGRTGLTEDELLDVLSTDAEVLADFRRRSPRSPEANRLPTVIWSRLRADLGPYLTERRADGTMVLGFYHRQVGDVIATRYLGGAVGHARHAGLAAYFGQQASWSDPAGAIRVATCAQSAGATPNIRKLAELPYQLTAGEQWAELEERLCDFEFLEAKLRAGLAFQLKSDFDLTLRARATPPVTQVREAVSAAFTALRTRPHLATQTLYNRLVWHDKPGPTLADSLEAADRRLAACPWWIRSAAPQVVQAAETAPFEIASSIQSLAPSGRAVAVAGTDGSAEIVDVSSGARLHRRGPDRTHVRAVLLRDDRGLIFVHDDGSVRPEFGPGGIAGRPGERLAVEIPDYGVVLVRADHTLVVWNTETGVVTPLAADLPHPLVALRVSPGGEAILYVAGQKPQQVGVVRDPGRWSAQILPWNGPRILDADIGPSGQHLVLSTLDRQLRVLDARTGGAVGEVAYEVVPKAVLKGPVQRCRLAAVSGDHRVLFATPVGQLALWNWAAGKIERLDDYASFEAREDVALLEWLSPPSRVLLSTQAAMRSFVPQPTSSGERHHNTAVTACAVGPDGRIISIALQDHAVTWFDGRGLRPLARAYCRRPTAVATTDDPDVVYVGTEEGLVWRFRFGSPEPTAEQVVSRMGSVVSVIPGRDASFVVADRSGCTLRFLPDRSESICLQYAAEGEEHRKTVSAVDGQLVSWGENKLVGSVESLVALLPAAGVTHNTWAPLPSTWNEDRAARKRAALYYSTELLRDTAVSPNGTRLCLAGKQVEVRPVGRRGGVATFRRQVAAAKVAFLTDNLLAVALGEEGWVEVWYVTEDLPTLAAIDVDGPVSCLAVRDNWLVVGSKTGHLRSARLDGSGWNRGT